MLLHFAGEEVHKIFKTLDGTGEDIKDYKLAKDSPRSISNHKRTWSTNATFFVQRNRILAKHLTSKTQAMKSCRYMRVYWVQRPRSSPANHSSRPSSSRLRRRTLRETDLTLKNLLGLGRAMEISEIQASGTERTKATRHHTSKQPKMMNLFTASDNRTTTSTTLPLKSQKPCQPKAQDNSKLPKVTVKFGTTEVRMLIGTQALV